MLQLPLVTDESLLRLAELFKVECIYPRERLIMLQEIYSLGRGQIFNSPVSFKGYKTQLSNVTLQHRYLVLSAQVDLIYTRFPGGASGKESSCQLQKTQETLGSSPGLGRFPGGGNGTPLQDSCLENPMEEGAWQATVHGITKSRTSEHRHIWYLPKPNNQIMMLIIGGSF